MPAPGVLNRQNGGGNRRDSGNGQGQQGGGEVAVVVPFVRASDEHLQPSSIDETRTLTGNQQDLGIFDVPAYGYIRWLDILVTATGGDNPMPYAPELERATIPQTDDLASAMRILAGEEV
jgi:hypothetical protein